MYTTLIAVILLTIGSLSLHASSFEYYPYLGEDNLYGFAEFQGGLKYDYVGSFREDLAVVMRNGKYGYIDRKGKLVIPLRYDYAYSFSEGLARVYLHEQCGFIDKSGFQVIPFKYDNAWDYTEGLAAVVLNDKYGYIDMQGNEVIPLQYDYAYYFHNDTARRAVCQKMFGQVR